MAVLAQRLGIGLEIGTIITQGHDVIPLGSRGDDSLALAVHAQGGFLKQAYPCRLQPASGTPWWAVAIRPDAAWCVARTANAIAGTAHTWRLDRTHEGDSSSTSAISANA